ncbi:ester cyclase [Streptomyces sp. NPDC087420]|uniref:ester cyclase n=1 Tax=Streptomyces sp. NPDC087420 TaxID=3365785 RepID=UPI0038341174
MRARRRVYPESFLLNGVRRNLPSFRTQIADLIAAFPDRAWQVEHVVVEGNLICALYTITGTHQGAYNGIQPTGRTFRTSEIAHYRVADGKLAESWYVVDEADLKRQLTQP